MSLDPLPAVIGQGIVLMTLVLEYPTLVPDVVLEAAQDMLAVADEWGVPQFEVLP